MASRVTKRPPRGSWAGYSSRPQNRPKTSVMTYRNAQMTAVRLVFALGLLLASRAAAGEPPAIEPDSTGMLPRWPEPLGMEIPLHRDSLADRNPVEYQGVREYRGYWVAVTPARNAVGDTIRVVARRPGAKAPAGLDIGRSPTLMTVVDDDGFFYGLSGDHLLIDVGCCPGPRGLRIYDLRTGQRCFEGTYEEDVVEYRGRGYQASPSLREGRWLTFWEPVEQPAVVPPCPDARDWDDVGYDEEVTLDLVTLHVVRSGKFKCFPRQ
jgi:hypothetical protein